MRWKGLRPIVGKAEIVATKWAELRAMTGKSEAQAVSSERERYSVFVLGNLAQYCDRFASVHFVAIKYILFSKKYETYVLLKYSAFIALIFCISRVPHQKSAWRPPSPGWADNSRSSSSHVKSCISPVKNLAMLLQAEIQILECCFTRQ